MGKQFQPDMFYSAIPAGSTCEHCGGYAAPNQRTGKPKRFCSSECNQKFKNERDKATKRKEQECSWCGQVFIGTSIEKYCQPICYTEMRKAKQRERAWQTNPEKRAPNLDACKCCGADISDKPFTIFCSRVCRNRWYRYPIPRTEPMPRNQGAVNRQKAISEARSAWREWIKERAPDWWVRQYYEATGKPWRNPRLSDAEKYRMQYALDEEYAISERMRRQITKARKRDGVSEVIRGAIRRNGASALVRREFGYTIAELKDHLERQFTCGMNWEKFKAGRIHIDHIVPQKEFDLSDDDQWRKCWCLSNLRPMWARDNIRKGARLEVML